MSSRRVVLDARVSGVRVSVRDGTEGPVEPSRRLPREEPVRPAPEHRAAIPLVNAKEIQRKAFERGREREREEATEILRSAGQALKDARDAIVSSHAADRAGLEDFAVKLACTVGEVLVGKIIDEDQHDVRALVRTVLDSVLPEAHAPEVEVRGHPDDVARLGPEFERHFPGPTLNLVSDRALAQGEYRVRAGEMEVFSGVRQRLEDMRAALLKDARRSDDS